MAVDYTFKDPTPGQKFIWVEFKTPDGRTDRRSAQIEIVGSSDSGFRNALFFDGNQQSPSVQVLNTYTMGKFNNLTMEAWVRLRENPNVRYSYPIIYKRFVGGAAGDSYAYSFDITPQKKLRFTYTIEYPSAGQWAPVEIESTAAITPDTWTHVAVLYYTGAYTGSPLSDSMVNKISLYINGQQVATRDQTGSIGGGSETHYGDDVMIGNDGLDNFSGLIDEVRLSNALQYLGTSFSVPQVPFALNPGSPTGIAPTLALLLCHFDEDAGNPTCSSGSGTTFNTTVHNIAFVSSIPPSEIPTPLPTSTPIPTLTPTPTPTPQPAKRVFVTSTTYTGNLGGLSGADSKCQARADAVSLGGTWKVWLSDSNGSTASYLNHNYGPYKLLNNTIVANNWFDLTSGSIRTPINITENNQTINDKVWSSTFSNGNSYSNSYYGVTDNCNNWTNGGQEYFAHSGSTAATDEGWSLQTGRWSCNTQYHLYCFEE